MHDYSGRFSPSLLPRDARRSSSQGGGMFRSMDAYVLVIGLIAFGSMVSEGTMFDWSGVYFESVVKPGPGWCRWDTWHS